MEFQMEEDETTHVELEAGAERVAPAKERKPRPERKLAGDVKDEVVVGDLQPRHPDGDRGGHQVSGPGEDRDPDDLQPILDCPLWHEHNHQRIQSDSGTIPEQQQSRY